MPIATHKTLALTLILALNTLLPGCEDAGKVNLAVDALKERENQAVARETSTQERELELVARERKLAEETASLAAQKAELELLRVKLQEEIAKTEELQKTLALRAKRGPAPTVSAQRVLIIDPATDEILHEKNADLRGQVASTQKLLTALILVEEGNLDQIVTIEKRDTDAAPTKFGLKVGEQFTRRQLLTALLVRSFNDIAEALARDNAGSVAAFREKMNQRAAELGMNNSHFANPHGLPDESQYSTARDMAVVAKAADTWPVIREMVRNKTFDFKRSDGTVTTLTNTNRVMRSYPPCDGMKTGYTNAAGFCLISSGELNGRRRIVVVLNGQSRSVWTDSQALLEWSLKG
ncbi:D-alanyl-D-alanine carboxypeptidase [Phragmitibacter flavus]|uniref:D-alanyl-D-alanine carboxypeptidase n=1 Tax=Phragmitibacter flavus TaxID=2576071 RepID=A0A5R8KKF4_9BACT|nr:D-alanyl-D-alanine carboxypeptidase family protein [Phragmitibacter flavus]TLD72782.1 D-alanyl-D-alanine carboxypeptidase [Phragmitibacter flavus]